jgi:S-adenosylmethionine hydrolase
MIVLFTDYGLQGPYVGQVEAVLYQHAPGENVVNLLAHAPRQNPKASAYLLEACTKDFLPDTVFFCVVDPGVGSFKDKPVAMMIDHSWFVGPDNGLFDIVARRASSVECWEITWQPEKLSSSFHGRDLYAPICAMLANGMEVSGEKIIWRDRHNWPEDLHEIIYIDHFGNCVTGIRAKSIKNDRIIKVTDQEITFETTFSDVQTGQVFWYENSNGMVEIAVNKSNAAENLSLAVGSKVDIL